MRRSARPTALFLLAGSAVLVCLVFFPQERYRAPVIDPALIVVRGGRLRPATPVSMQPNVLVVVPTYNERDNLPVLVRAVLARDGYRLLVVDDGSPDGTGADRRRSGARYPGASR